MKHIVEPKEIKYKWNNLTRSTMHLVRKEITNEDEGKMVHLLCALFHTGLLITLLHRTGPTTARSRLLLPTRMLPTNTESQRVTRLCPAEVDPVCI